MQELKAAGDIRGFGLGVNEWQAIRDALEETDLDCCMLAGRYSLLDRDAAETFLPLAQARGVGLVLAGVYNSGILAAPAGGRTKFNYADADPAVIARVEALRGVCDDHGVALANEAGAALGALPGATSAVSATVACRVDLSGVALPGLPGSLTIESTVYSPLDTFRGR